MAANAYPLILYDNRFLDGTPVATDTDSDTAYSALNIYDQRTYTWMKFASFGTKYITVDCGSAKSADTLGIIGHNLGTASATVSVESSATGDSWTERLAGFSPTDDYAIMKIFTTAEARYWRIKIVTAAVTVQIAVCVLGERLDFPRYPRGSYDPATQGLIASTKKSKAGHPLGTTLAYTEIAIKPSFTRLTDAWIRDTFEPAWDAHLGILKWFFWVWDITNHSGDVYYVKVPDNYKYSAPYDPVRRTLTLQFEGVKET